MTLEPALGLPLSSTTVPMRSVMKVKVVFLAVPSAGTTCSSMPPSIRVSAMEEPSTPIRVLPDTLPKGALEFLDASGGSWVGGNLNGLGDVGRQFRLGKLAVDESAVDLAAVGAAQLAAAVGLVVFPVAGIKLAIGAAQDAEAVHFAVGPLAFEAVGGVGGQDARAIEAAGDGLAVIAPALAPAGDDMTIGDHAMGEVGGEALALAVMGEGGGAKSLGIAVHAFAGPSHGIAGPRAGAVQGAIPVLEPLTSEGIIVR